MITVQKEWYITETDKYECPYCKKQYKFKGISTHIWRVHSTGIEHKPSKGLKPWNYLETKETNSKILESTKKMSKTMKELYINKVITGRASSPEKELERKRKISDSMKLNENGGGYRQGAGIGKSGYFNGIWCDSSWELAYVIYNIDHNIEFKRNKEKFNYKYNNRIFKYIPDFIENNTFIEIKGYKTSQWEEKLKQFVHPIKVLYKDEMKVYLDYTIEKYGKDFIRLYTQ